MSQADVAARTAAALRVARVRVAALYLEKHGERVNKTLFGVHPVSDTPLFPPSITQRGSRGTIQATRAGKPRVAYPTIKHLLFHIFAL